MNAKKEYIHSRGHLRTPVVAQRSFVARGGRGGGGGDSLRRRRREV